MMEKMDLFSNKTGKKFLSSQNDFISNEQMSLDDGIKLLESTFRLLEKCKCWTDHGKDVYSILMYRDSTGDFFYTNALEDDFFFKNSRITTIRFDGVYDSGKVTGINCSSSSLCQHINDVDLHSEQHVIFGNTYNELFDQYNQLNRGMDISKFKNYPVDWSQIRYDFSFGPIIPRYSNLNLEELIPKLKRKLKDNESDLLSDDMSIILESYSFKITQCINYFKFMDMLSKIDDKFGIDGYRYMYENRFSLFPKYTGLNNSSAYENSIISKISFSYCMGWFEILREEIIRYVEELHASYVIAQKNKPRNTWEDRVRNFSENISYVTHANWYPDDWSDELVDYIFTLTENDG